MSAPAAVRRSLVQATWAGLLTLEVLTAYAYWNRGTWWHFLLHQYVGWGLGLAVAGLVWAWTGRRVSAVPAMVGGQLVSLVPDLMFRFMRMPHEPSMDLWVGHISIHRGPSPLLVATGVLLLGGLGWFLGGPGWFLAPGRRRLAAAVSLAGPVLLLVACLLAEPLPERLADYPAVTSPVVPR